jgi:hypothetical protein
MPGMDAPDKPFQFSLRMLFLYTALIAAGVACVVAWGNYQRSMSNIWILQNGPVIKEVREEQERYKRNNNGKADPDLDRVIQRLERGEHVDW